MQADPPQAAATSDSPDQLERLRQRLWLVSSAARFGIWEYDFEHETLWVSPELAELYGVEAATFTWADFVDLLHPDDVVAQLLTPTPSYPFGEVNEFLFRVRDPDGGYLHIRSRSVTYGQGEVPVRKLGVHIDMSHDTLLRLSRLSDANARLQETMAIAAHDMRSPLRMIRSLISLLQLDHVATLPDEVTGILDEIERRADRLSRLVEDTLAYGQAGLVADEPRPVDVAELLNDVVALTDRRQCRIQIESRVDGPVAVAAATLSGCVRNLVDNACKHHDKSAGTVRVSAERLGTWLVVEVADDGPGIPPQIRERIFEPFHTSDPTRGSGLGLAHVHREADRFDAVIQVMSEQGEGSTFTLRWPIRTTPG